MKMELEGKVALVAGASRGIGLSIAKALDAEGCRVTMTARGREGLEKAALEFKGKASIHAGDAADPVTARALVAEVAGQMGGLDVLICNAGSGASVPPGTETEMEWRRVLDMNLFPALNMIAAARPHMRRGGSIVCVSSIAGLAALGAPVAYSAAKAALNAAVKGLAWPLAGEGLRINAVAPGNILFPGGTWDRKLAQDRDGVEAMLVRDVALGRLGAPEEIAAVTVFLASPRSSFITGTVLVADGGQLR
ncbi:MAG TPA: SDR family oxidoreductase [Rhizomicrobium sp.]|nr:SDR family oxidoreductase [Rhizomicrobium sp.]